MACNNLKTILKCPSVSPSLHRLIDMSVYRPPVRPYPISSQNASSVLSLFFHFFPFLFRSVLASLHGSPFICPTLHTFYRPSSVFPSARSSVRTSVRPSAFQRNGNFISGNHYGCTVISGRACCFLIIYRCTLREKYGALTI